MATLKQGDLVRIHYTGRLSTDGSMFESTDEETAKKGGIWSSASRYGPRLAIYGKGAMIAGIEDAIATLKVGQSGNFKIKPDKAFGERSTELIRVISESDFLKGGVKPSVGLMVMIEGIPATVKTVSSGRVILDFNHPFAGQDVEYSIQLLDIVTDPAEKARSLSAEFGIPVRIEKDGEKNKVIIAKSSDKQKAAALAAALKASLSIWGEVEIEKQ